MTFIAKPRLHHPTLQQNKVGYTRRDYEGRISTLCAGCGHDSVSARFAAAAPVAIAGMRPCAELKPCAPDRK